MILMEVVQMNTLRRSVLKFVGATGVLGLGRGSVAADGNDGGETTTEAGETTTTTDGQEIDWKQVGEALGKQGEQKKGGVYKVSFPRSDLDVSVQDVQVKTALSFGSWTAFKPTKNGNALVLGDLVLTGEEYNRVISKLQQGGINQTAIHKHLPDMSTPIWWTHVKGTGDPVEMAKTINNGLGASETPMKETGGSQNGQLDLPTDKLDEIIGHNGKASSGVYKFGIGVDQTVTIDGVEIPTPMGTTIAFGFQPLGDGKAAINGDFAMTAQEVNPVIQALRERGIQVVSLHNHMLEEKPELYYMHFWETGDATKLAKGLRAGLDEATSVKG
jgi:hypothetical protein